MPHLGFTKDFEMLLKNVGAQVIADACNPRARGVSMPSSMASESHLSHLMASSTTTENSGMHQ